MDIALAQDLDISIVELPEGDDPDSYHPEIRREGVPETPRPERLLHRFQSEAISPYRVVLHTRRKTQAVRSIVQSIAKMKDELKRNFYIKEVATKYDIYESVLYRELEKWAGERSRGTSFGAPDPTRLQGSEPGLLPETHFRPPEKKRTPVAERDVLKLLLEQPAEMIEFIFSYITID